MSLDLFHDDNLPLYIPAKPLQPHGKSRMQHARERKSTLLRFRTLSVEHKDRLYKEIMDNCDLIGDCCVYRNKDRDPQQYGLKYIQGKMRTASRFVLCYVTRESLDKNADACHRSFCPYRACCNPKHLYWGSHQENCSQREAEKKEYREMYAVLPMPPCGLGHETHAVA